MSAGGILLVVQDTKKTIFERNDLFCLRKSPKIWVAGRQSALFKILNTDGMTWFNIISIY